jgi:hypothetical protein
MLVGVKQGESMFKSLVVLFLCASTVLAKPHFDPQKLELPKVDFSQRQNLKQVKKMTQGLPILRVDIAWSKDETYKIALMQTEFSGTGALYARATSRDSLGSYHATLIVDGEKYHASAGTGRLYRELVRTISFRFPLKESASSFKLTFEAEDINSGEIKKVWEKELNMDEFKIHQTQTVEAKVVRAALKSPSLKVVFYAEAFDNQNKANFEKAVQKAIAAIEQNIPYQEYFEFISVYAPSEEVGLGRAEDFGPNIKERKTFLGLYHPYWAKFGRWYHVVYATDQTKYRNSLAQVAYDYPIALVNSSQYWGVGNYKENTAIPTENSYFSFLLLHEFGHFMGLNEEYEGGGRTELEFAPKTKEPWSQNLTFNPDQETLKWKNLLAPGIPIPTSHSDYSRFGGASVNPIGAYHGGYADSDTVRSHKPAMNCTMNSGGSFCQVCKDAMKDLIHFDLGNPSL